MFRAHDDLLSTNRIYGVSLFGCMAWPMNGDAYAVLTQYGLEGGVEFVCL